MEETPLQEDFKEFLNLLTSNQVEYLLVGGYAVSYHGYPRTFGFASATKQMLVMPEKILRMGVPPHRIEVLTSISGVDFKECFVERVETEIDGVKVNVVSLKHLRANKMASGRPKDLVDLGHLPTP